MVQTDQAGNCISCKGKKAGENKILVIHNAGDLRQLSRAMLPKYDVIFIQLQPLTNAGKIMWQEKLLKDHNACGCTTGAYFLIAGFVFDIVFAIVSFRPVWEAPVTYISFGIGVLVLTAVTGKIAGLLYAKVRLQLNIFRLQKIINNKTLPACEAT